MNPYTLYLSYSFLQSDANERLTSLLLAYQLKNRDFQYQYISVSKDDPAYNLPSNKRLSLAVEEKMKMADCLLILAGVHDTLGRWINLEIDIAKKLKKPIIVIEAVKSKHTAHQEKRSASQVVPWNDLQVGEAILSSRKQS